MSTGPRPIHALVPHAVSSLTTGGAWSPAARGGPTEPTPRTSSTLPALPHPATPTDSFEALYVPADALVAPTPVAVHFLEVVRPLLYPDPAVNFVEYQRRYPNGLTFRVELHGNGKLGLPTVFDYDVLFAVLHLAAERGPSDTGVVTGVTFRDLARAVGWSDEVYGGSRHKAIKTALGRWAALSIRTNIDLGTARSAADARDGRARPQAVDALPRRVLPALRWYDVLKYGIDAVVATDEHGEDETAARTELLGTIRIDPTWLGLVASGYTAWVDREFHASLDERYAKRLYEVLLVRALRVPTWSAQEPWSLSVNELLEELGATVTDGQGARIRRTVVGKFDALQRAGVVGEWREQPGRGDKHRITLTPGERLLAARSNAGLRMQESPELARLVWALQHGPWAFSPTEARHAAESQPGVVLRVLQRGVYLAACGWEPRVSWGAWLKDALRKEYRFEGDPKYEAWLDRRLAGYRVPAWVDVRTVDLASLVGPGTGGAHVSSTDTGAITAPVVVQPSAEAAPNQADEARQPSGSLVDDLDDTTLWGRVRRRLRSSVDVPGRFEAWLAPLVVVAEPSPDAPTLVLEAPDDFAAEWVSRRWQNEIALLATEEGATPVTVRIAGARSGVPARNDVGRVAG